MLLIDAESMKKAEKATDNKQDTLASEEIDLVNGFTQVNR